MKLELLPQIESAKDLQNYDARQLVQLAAEIREVLCSVVEDRAAHFASNLGVVELCIALHLAYDFKKDRLIWDTGHQIYPHKLVTGRYKDFDSIRTRGGLMGYPNPEESEYDLFMTGHAGCSVSTALGLKAGDDLIGQNDRRSVAVIGDGALPSGIVWEAMTNAVGLKKDMLVILNDNRMGICPRVGGLAEYLDKARLAPFYNGLKRDVAWLLNKVPVVGEPVEHALGNFKEAIKNMLHGGMLWEELGFRYVGPVDGHDLPALQRHLEMVRDIKGPVMLHVLTEKGHGFEPACEDPVRFHTPAPFTRTEDNEIVPLKKSSSVAYTNLVSDAIYSMMRPIVDIYSTFLQRSYDQIFQEVALQNLPVTFTLDRAGLCGPDGPTHHGAFDNTYMRSFPNIVVMAPGDAADVAPMLDFSLTHDGPVSIRYPKTSVATVERSASVIELGKSEIYKWGSDGMFVAFGTQFADCVAAAEQLQTEGLDIGVINARFAKPLDTETILKAVRECPFVITVEESTVVGGFGSAVLEAASDAGLNTSTITRLGIPDRFVEHGERAELLDSINLSLDGLVRVARNCSSGSNAAANISAEVSTV